VSDQGRTIVAAILAIALGVGVCTLTAGVLWEAIFRTESSGLSENATQILTTAFGGIIGVLGSYIGFRAGAASRDANIPDELEPGLEEGKQ
jgi:hypothetical protein